MIREFYIKNLWRWKCGLAEREPRQQKLCVEELETSEWCDEFEKYMRNRLILGAYRYWPIADQNYEGYDLLGEIEKRVRKYDQDHNLEHLVDASNICMLAYIDGKRRGEKLIPIDDGEHTREIM